MFQPSGCIMFLRETLLLSKFLSKENKILTCLSTKLLAVRKGGWGFVEREKKTAGQIEHWVTARYWQAGAGYIFLPF